MNFFTGKFVKGFISGGVAGISLAVANGVSFSTLDEAKHVVSLLIIAFLSGAFHATWNYFFPTQNPLL